GWSSCWTAYPIIDPRTSICAKCFNKIDISKRESIRSGWVDPAVASGYPPPTGTGHERAFAGRKPILSLDDLASVATGRRAPGLARTAPHPAQHLRDLRAAALASRPRPGAGGADRHPHRRRHRTTGPCAADPAAPEQRGASGSGRADGVTDHDLHNAKRMIHD